MHPDSDDSDDTQKSSVADDGVADDGAETQSVGKHRVTLSRLNRRVLSGLVGALVVGAVIGALALALVFPRADMSVIGVAQQPVRVTAAVSLQPVRAIATMSGTVSVPATAPVLPNAANGSGGPDVVSGKVHEIGDTVSPWDVIGEVSNRPVFAVLASVPLFRDLAPDMTGTDVSAVQQSLIDAGLLKYGPSGRMDGATSSALAKLFKAAGYPAPLLASVIPQQPDPWTGVTPDPPKNVGLPLADTAWIPAGGLPVALAAPVGQVLDTDHPLVELTTRAAVVSARADMLAVASFQVGAPVDVQVGSATPAGSTVLSLSDFNSGPNGISPGYDVTVALPDGVDAVGAANQPVIVTEATQPGTGPAVPLLAIRTDNQGSYVFKAASDENSRDSRVNVTVVGQANGYAILADDPQLPVGAQIVVSGERA
ncbi:MAG: hypothetical protein FWF36_08780 [Propionibacteriaceae bacterium]|nr:hypothetical protein [Propionibacteriaceae bacterium]